MKLSIAMTTYNGEKFLVEQLDSLRLQTMKVDEVIICDDGSSDNTAEVIRAYIEKWNLEEWSFYSNPKNLGWIKNFHQVIGQTSGSIVFFCDQDDIWDLNKVETMVKCMEENPTIGVLACRLRLINHEGQLLAKETKSFPFSSNETGEVKQNHVTEKFCYSISPGCTMAVTRSLIETLDGCTNKEKIPHDALYWKLGTLIGKAFVLDGSLLGYRVHDNNASNPTAALGKRIKKRSVRLNEAKQLCDSMQRIVEAYASLEENKGEYVEILGKLLEFCKNRCAHIKNGEMRKLILHYWSARKFYHSIRMFIADAMCMLR